MGLRYHDVIARLVPRRDRYRHLVRVRARARVRVRVKVRAKARARARIRARIRVTIRARLWTVERLPIREAGLPRVVLLVTCHGMARS